MRTIGARVDACVHSGVVTGRQRQAAVAAGHPRATDTAVRLLRAGGSAGDAAIGADAVMGVVEPTGTGVGGDLMAVVATHEGVSVLNGAGRSGRRTDPESVPDNGHGFVPSVGGWAVTVPGAVAAWQDLHGRFGRLPWPSLFEPAIEAATEGAELGATGSRLWESSRDRLDAAGSALYFPAGTAPAPGERWRNPALAAVLKQIAADGSDALYRGPLAQAVCESATAAGGNVHIDDLAGHRSEWVEPLQVGLGDHELITVPPPCQGTVTALAAEWVHDRGLLGATGDDAGVEAAASMVEALDRAFAVALDCLADPAAAEVPDYDEMRLRMAGAPRRGPMPLGPGTVFTVVFTAEQAVVLTSSVCDRFGSGVTVPEGGFVLQSRGRGFSTDLSHPNAVAPNKRPYHTIVPTLVLENGQPMLGMGVVGGIMQPQGKLQILHRVLGGASLTAAVEAGRFRLIGEGQVTTEASLEPDWRAAIGAAGYELVDTADVIGGFGGAQAVLSREGTLTAASDPRRDGTSAVIGITD
ncbi:MAG: gamma-glutamyltransferase [Acidimicrobiaceae bacterium]|nr:gamma-glutamyltransferase [Acidimicrobiaceae bacterium]